MTSGAGALPWVLLAVLRAGAPAASMAGAQGLPEPAGKVTALAAAAAESATAGTGEVGPLQAHCT
ncbi:MAG: hypothetical protein KA371_03700 [Acidobacteria bacterium]|nr:hypothetical protein [Acidobacteriota bacterium]